jgi:hypothetical protein
MAAIVSLVLDAGSPLTTAAAAPLLDRLFAAIRRAEGLERVLAVGLDRGLLAQAERAGLIPVPLSAPMPLRRSGLLPAGGAEALEHAAEGRRALLVSCANPMLTAEVVEDFLRRAEEADRPCMSVVAPVDHPCQLNQLLRMREAGVVLPLEGLRDGGARVLTEPFRFLWAAREVHGRGPLYIPRCSSGETVFHELPGTAATRVEGPLLLRESPDRARLSLPVDEVLDAGRPFGVRDCSEVLGLGLHLFPGLPCLAFRGGDGGARLGFTARRDERAVCLLFARAADGAERAASGDLEGGALRLDASWDFRSPVSYSLLRSLDRDGEFDLEAPFPEDHGLWRVDSATSCRINCRTGRVIHGRQEFPEVFEPDGSLFALTATEAVRFENLLEEGRVAAFELNRNCSLHVRTDFDLLRCTAKLRAEMP